MERMRNPLVCLLFVLSLAASGACGDDPPSASPGADAGTDTGAVPDMSNVDGDCQSVLVFVTDQTMVVANSDTTTLSVRHDDCTGTVIVGSLVSFEIVGEAGGSLLSAMTAITTADGVATLTLTAGSDAATFDIKVTAGDATSVLFNVTVSTTGIGSIDVTLSYAGELTFSGFTATLHPDTVCDDLGPFDLPVAFQSVEVPTITVHPEFSGVPALPDYAVAVVAEQASGAMGYGCADTITVASATTTDVSIEIGDIPITFDGVYELDNELDLSSVLPPSIETTLLIFAEMTDDNEPDGLGNDTTEDYGLDPAAFLLDFVYRQFCCWEAEECAGGGYSWECCQAQDFQHNYGDLELIYTENFTSWDGAQPYATGMCGALAQSWGLNPALQLMVDGWITALVPDIALKILTMVGDLSRAFTEMNIISELTVSEIYLDKTGGFTHELLRMVVDVHDFDGVVHTYEFDLADAGLSNLDYSGETTVTEDIELVIPEHSFQVDFGQLLHYVYLNVVIPTFDCDPDGDGTMAPCESTADLFRTWLDCAEIGDDIVEALVANLGISPVTDVQAESFCNLGLGLAGTYLEGEIADVTDYETIMTLSGTADAGTLNERREPTELINGVWDGTLTEETVEIGDFDGEFTGERTDDAPE